jgi:hypothetical protein
VMIHPPHLGFGEEPMRGLSAGVEHRPAIRPVLGRMCAACWKTSRG